MGLRARSIECASVVRGQSEVECPIRHDPRQAGEDRRVASDRVAGAGAQRVAALIIAGAHGIAGLAANGHLSMQKWKVEAPELIDHLITVTTGSVAR